MIFPINFVTGFAVGVVTTYIYKDEKAKAWAGRSAGKLKSSAGSVLSVFKKKEKAEVASQQSGEVIEGTVDAVAA